MRMESRPSAARVGAIYREITRPPHPRGRVRQSGPGAPAKNGVHEMWKHIWLIGGSGAAIDDRAHQRGTGCRTAAERSLRRPACRGHAGPLLRVAGRGGQAHTVNGDVVRLAAGTYDGGVTITKSIRVVGAGEGRTMIDGGGPGAHGQGHLDVHRPVVELIDLTITGGVNTGTALSGKVTGFDAFGGGILVPHSNGNGGAGASLTLRRVTVTGNEVRPSTTIPSPSGRPVPRR